MSKLKKNTVIVGCLYIGIGIGIGIFTLWVFDCLKPVIKYLEKAFQPSSSNVGSCLTAFVTLLVGTIAYQGVKNQLKATHASHRENATEWLRGLIEVEETPDHEFGQKQVLIFRRCLPLLSASKREKIGTNKDKIEDLGIDLCDSIKESSYKTLEDSGVSVIAESDLIKDIREICSILRYYNWAEFKQRDGDDHNYAVAEKVAKTYIDKKKTSKA